MTAASFAPPINPRAIFAIIAKDTRLLWPFALVLALAQFVLTALFLEKEGYSAAIPDFGDIQITLELFHTTGMPILMAIFIATLIHTDPATDVRNDWMSRPISPLDIVIAKALGVIAVIIVPLVAGSIVYGLSHPAVDSDELALMFFLTMIGCTFMLVLAWLASSPVQALIAPFGLAILALAVVLTVGSFAIEVERPGTDATAEFPQAEPAPPPALRSAPPAPVPATAPTQPDAPALPDAAGSDAPEPDAPAPDSTAPADSSAAPGLEDQLDARLDLTVNEQRREELVFGERRGASRADRRANGRSDGSGVLVLGWLVLIGQLLLAFAAAGVVLWLLLARRRFGAARLAFLGFFGAAVLLLMLQSQFISPGDGFISFGQIAPVSVRPSPPLEQRLAAFERHDINNDGRLDRTEYAAVLDHLGFSSQFDSLWMQRDDDADGFVTPEEYRAAIPGAPGGPPAPDLQRFVAFTARDVNQDRRLDRTEYMGVLTDLGFAEQFDTLWMQRDGDRDGFVSAEEYGMPNPQ